MKIQFLNGGLANQVFQYIFVRFAEMHHPGEQWFFDDSFFFVNDIHNGYELEKVFGVKPNLLSNYFEEDVWQELIRLKKEGSSIPQSFQEMGIPMVMLAETSNYTQWNPFRGKVLQIPANEFRPDIVNLPVENIYYHGYWINKHYLESYRREILSELQFSQISDQKNLEYAERIKNSMSVGIHIRRGDFLKIGWDLPDDYYKVNVQTILATYPEAVFFVFSDDLAWCEKNAENLGLNLAKEIVYITGNVAGKNYVDMQLLSMCKGILMSNSSFAYLAALMNENLQFVVNPTMREV